MKKTPSTSTSTYMQQLETKIDKTKNNKLNAIDELCYYKD
jgi:hypothetical protein